MAWPSTTDALTILDDKCSATFVMRDRAGATAGWIPYTDLTPFTQTDVDDAYDAGFTAGGGGGSPPTTGQLWPRREG